MVVAGGVHEELYLLGEFIEARDAATAPSRVGADTSNPASNVAQCVSADAYA
jgi:hypothetical protein